MVLLLVYGSDAIAGVANFVMRRDFEGIMFDGPGWRKSGWQWREFANALLAANGLPQPDGQLDGRDVLLRSLSVQIRLTVAVT